MNSRPIVLTVSLLWAAAALAEDGVPELTVGVGKTVSTSVGLAMGVVCDDLTLISVSMATKDKNDNQLVITGLKEGKTLCRVGNDQQGAKRFVAVRVSRDAPPSGSSASDSQTEDNDARVPRSE